MKWLGTFVLLLGVAACSKSSGTTPGEARAKQACGSLSTGYDRAAREVDAINKRPEELAHPAHVGRDGFDPTVWAHFERAAEEAGDAAERNPIFRPLDVALRRLLDARGTAGVEAALVFSPPLTEAFDECYRHAFLDRP